MRRLFPLLLLLSFFDLSTTAVAQLPTSNIGGTVTDPQGALVTGARVTVSNQATGVSRQQQTGGDGSYFFTNLTPGYYTVRVEAKGFAVKEFKDVKLDVG